MRLAIADPPYPMLRASHPRNDSSRARRWYGDPGYRASGDADGAKADEHPDAHEWDDPGKHRALLLSMDEAYDGWAIATAHDGLPAYGELPRGCRVEVRRWLEPTARCAVRRMVGLESRVFVPCHGCGREFKRLGLSAHRRQAHGEAS